MFTGIIEEIGTLTSLRKHSSHVSWTLRCPSTAKNVRKGSSVAVNGVCLTVVAKTRHAITVDIVPETLRRTTFFSGKKGDQVNLELPLRATGRLEGHFVLGHVDGTARVERIFLHHKNQRDLTLSFPRKFSPFIIDKGSITLHGVSLTVYDVSASRCTVSLVPYTLTHTNLSSLKEGDRVNMEFDMIGKYLRRFTHFF